MSLSVQQLELRQWQFMEPLQQPDKFFGYTAGQGAVGGAFAGGIIGAVIGGITILFKNSKSYEINGDKVKWTAFIEMIIK
jgi:prolipoprotein diacylglyceryltransferase